LFVSEVGPSTADLRAQDQLAVCVESLAQWLRRRQLVDERGKIIWMQTPHEPLETSVAVFVWVELGQVVH
jgi:hypothetical protein